MAKELGDIAPISVFVEPHQTLHPNNSLRPSVCMTGTFTRRPLGRFRHSFESHINYAKMNITAALRIYPNGDEEFFSLLCIFLSVLQCNVVIEEILSTLSELIHIQTNSFPSKQSL